jgi:glycosyltransferase involved in cell wall biosynthesis
MRVLLWTELFWPYIGGIEVLSARLLPALEALGHEFVVVTSHGHLDLPDEASFQGIPVHRFPFRQALSSGDIELLFATRRRLAELKRAIEPELVHINGLGASTIFHLQTAGAYPAPVLCTVHAELAPGETAGPETLRGRLLHSADWVTCVSSTVLAQMRQQVPEIASRSSVIRNILELPAEEPQSLPAGAPRLLCLGRLIPLKGFDLALTALASLRHRFPGLRLIFAGDGVARRDLERQAAELELLPMVEFLGWVEPECVPALLNSVTMVLMPSRREGLPLVAIQAAMVGRPIVACRVGGLDEVVVEGQTGLFVDREDSDGLARAIAFLLEHPRAAQEMGQAARRWAEQAFDWQQTIAAYDEIYRRFARR